MALKWDLGTVQKTEPPKAQKPANDNLQDKAEQLHKLGKFKANQDQLQKQEQPAKPAEKLPEWNKGLSELLESRTPQKRLHDKIKEMEANRAETLKEMKRRDQLTEQERKAEDKQRFEEKLKQMEEQKRQTLRRLGL